MIAKIIKMTVPIQNPKMNGDPIGFIVVISTKFLNCLTDLEEEIELLFE